MHWYRSSAATGRTAQELDSDIRSALGSKSVRRVPGTSIRFTKSTQTTDSLPCSKIIREPTACRAVSGLMLRLNVPDSCALHVAIQDPLAEANASGYPRLMPLCQDTRAIMRDMLLINNLFQCELDSCMHG